MRKVFIMILSFQLLHVVPCIGGTRESPAKYIQFSSDITASAGGCLNLGFSCLLDKNWKVGAEAYIDFETFYRRHMEKTAYRVNFCFIPIPEHIGLYFIGSLSIYRSRLPEAGLGIGYEIPLGKDFFIDLEIRTGEEDGRFALKLGYCF